MADGSGIGAHGLTRNGKGPSGCLTHVSLIATKSQKHETDKTGYCSVIISTDQRSQIPLRES